MYTSARTAAVSSSKRLRSPFGRSDSQSSTEYDVEAGERTPLLFTTSAPTKVHHEESYEERRARQLQSVHTKALMGMVALILFLLIGIIIAVYLLFLQIPRPWPVSHPFYLVEREVWWPHPTAALQQAPLNKSAVLNVVLVHTRSESCRDLSTCTSYVTDVQKDALQRTGAHIPYNFLVGGDGMTYEGRGWKAQHGFSELPGKNDTIVVGVIGTYNDKQPDRVMVAEVKALITESIRRFALSPHYRMYGVTNSSQPMNDGAALYSQLAHLNHWRGMIAV